MERKESDTQIPDDYNTDSGFLSGQLLSGNLNSSEDLRSDDKDNKHNSEKDVVSDSYVQQDSGVLLSEQLSDVHISSPAPTVLEDKAQDIPPLDILFQQDDDGDTQLHIAAVHGCQKSIGILLKVCPTKTLLDMPNDFGHTALHLAVMSKHKIVTRMLVIAGASLGVRDLSGETPLHKATLNKDIKCLQALLAPLPEHSPRRLASTLNQKNYNGKTCVHLAAFLGHIETLQTLIYYGADINAAEGLAGWTALHIAARHGDAHLVQYLTERCVGIVLTPRDFAGRTPRRVAAPSLARYLRATSDDDSESDDDSYDSDNDSLFEKLSASFNPINVV